MSRRIKTINCAMLFIFLLLMGCKDSFSTQPSRTAPSSVNTEDRLPPSPTPAATPTPTPPPTGTVRHVSCNGDITSELKSAVNSSVNGDIVNIGAGTCSTSHLGGINDKNITIQGAGKGITNITASSGFASFNISGANSPMFRLTGFTLSGSTSTVVISIWGNQSPLFRGPFRIDHIEMNYPNSGVDGMIAIWGPVFGLIDHSDFVQNYEASILTNLEIDSESCSYNVGGTCTINKLQSAAGAALPYQPGSGKNLYIEDCTFTGTGSMGVAAIDTAYGGGRIVFPWSSLLYR